MYKIAVSIVLWVGFISVYAQATLKDTLKIEEVVVSGKSINRFQAGAKVEKIQELQFKNMQDGNLENILLRYTPIAVKGMAGSFSTIRLRGTSPDHTSINFGGININSMTLGHSNASNVPMYLFDEIGLQYGSSSVVEGSGSIGGAIHLGMDNNWVKGFKGEVRSAHGSFGEHLTGFKAYYGNGKFEGVTRAYYYTKTNDFTFYNTTYDFEKKDDFGKDVQQNARIDNKGIIQEINYRFNKKQFISTKVWYERDWHEIQQNMQTNAFQPKMRETLEDEHLRVWADYVDKRAKLDVNIGVGYVYDNSDHNNSTNTISTQRVLGKAEGEYEISSDKSIKVGLSLKSIFPDVYAYDNDLNREDWADLYASYYQTLFSKLTFSFNVRQAFVTNYNIPLTPALGLSYNVLTKESFLLNFNGNVSRSFRVPTFNDRFWIPGGNPDLTPEDGMNYELGSKIRYTSDKVSGELKVNAFYLDVDNWILWINKGSYWGAENVQRVKSKGIELQTNFDVKIGNYILSPGVNYTYNPVERVAVDYTGGSSNTDTEETAVGRQLEYVPLHRGVAYINIALPKVEFGLDANYTHWQYISQDDQTIPEFTLINSHINYNHIIDSSHSFLITASLNNILNIDYQSSAGFPMPRRNWRISIAYNFN